MGIFWKKKEVAKDVPRTLFDRIGIAAVGIHQAMSSIGLYDKCESDKDFYFWEDACYILSVLHVANIINSTKMRQLYLKISDMYPPELSNKSEECRRWFMVGTGFYVKEVYAYSTGHHNLPDVIIYNLTHPTQYGKKTFDEFPLTINIFSYMEAWAAISEIMGYYFFRKDEEIDKIPLGIDNY